MKTKSFNKTKQLTVFETEASLIGAVITFLNNSGWKTWRNNTYGLFDQKSGRYRKLAYQQKGVADIIGFHKQTGTMIAVEVKIGSDKISVDQHEFLTSLKKAKGYVFIARTLDQFLASYDRVKDRINEELLP